MSMNNLALLYLYQGRYEQSETLFTKVLETRQRVLGADHPDTLRTMANLGVLYRGRANYAQAESLCMRAWEVQRRVLGEEHPDTLTSLINLADLDRDQGRYEQAQARYTKVLEVRRRVLGHQHPRTSDALVWLGEVLLQQQHYGVAEPILREALTSYEKTTPDIWTRYHSQSMLGASLAGQQKYAEAETLLIFGYQGMLQRETTIPVYYRVELEQAGKWVVQLYRDWGKPAQAVEWREKLLATNGSSSARP
jgi:tetratricopeptide (TPR) repeat protein